VAPVNSRVRQHRLGRFARRQETGEGGHLPHLAIDARGGVADVEPHVAADVEDKDLDLADFGLNLLEQLDDLLLVARIGAEGMDLAALAGDLRHQGLQLVGVPARDDGGVAFPREAAGNRPARRISCADHDADLVSRH